MSNILHKTNNLKITRLLKRNKTISQINVTPMVDVMLVLLVIFMITAPLLTVGVPINLPKTKAKALPEDQTPLSITINKEEKIQLRIRGWTQVLKSEKKSWNKPLLSDVSNSLSSDTTIQNSTILVIFLLNLIVLIIFFIISFKIIFVN